MTARHPDLLTRAEAAALLRVSPTRLQQLGVPRLLAYSRPHMYHRQLCLRWLEENDHRIRREHPRTIKPNKRREHFLKLLGGKCVVCGATELLEFDHIDPKTKRDCIKWQWSFAAVEAEVRKCQILCVDCHRRKSAHESRVRCGLASGPWDPEGSQ